jgi:hypothetical protein
MTTPDDYIEGIEETQTPLCSITILRNERGVRIDQTFEVAARGTEEEALAAVGELWPPGGGLLLQRKTELDMLTLSAAVQGKLHSPFELWLHDGLKVILEWNRDPLDLGTLIENYPGYDYTKQGLEKRKAVREQYGKLGKG